MVNAVSGYMNNVSSLYNYNSNTVRNASSRYNNAGVNSRDDRQSYMNNDAVRYVAELQVGARNMLDSLTSVSEASTFDRMREAYNTADNAVRRDGNEAAVRDPESARTEAEPSDAARNVFDRVNGETAARTEAAGRDAAEAGSGLTRIAGGRAESETTPRTARTESGTAPGATRADNTSGAVRNMAESYNRMLDTAETGRGNRRLSGDLRSAAADYSQSLGRVGITVNDDGYLSVNEGRFASAERTGALEAAFSEDGANAGFMERLTGIAENLSGTRSASGRAASGADNAENSRASDNLTGMYGQNANNNSNSYSYAYGYSAPGTLFNLYA